MRIDVINVGDGACTALESCSPCSTGLTIIDCGTHNQSEVATTPGVAAATHLGGRLRSLTTMIVTHFDTDHWRGLLELAVFYGSRRPAHRDVRIFYPGMPNLGTGVPAAWVRAGLMALISTRDKNPINMLTLKKAWEQVSSVKTVPLFQGDVFRANARDWLVHWPPREIDVARGQKYATTIQKLRKLANEMAEDGYPNLRDQWDEAYNVWDDFEDSRDDIKTSPASAEPPPMRNVEAVDEDRVEPGDVDDSTISHIPEQHREKFRRLVNELEGIDNYFSLVLSVDDEFITFGDIEGTALDAVLAETLSGLALRERYALMLAPHHGSHQAHAMRLPTALLCISQNGSKHEANNIRHTDRHRSVAHHLSTWVSGTIHAWHV